MTAACDAQTYRGGGL